MGSLIMGALMPHPPILIPEIGGDEIVKIMNTQRAMISLGKRIRRSRCDTVILISPHGPIFSDGVGIYGEERLRGDFGRFGAGRVSMEFETDFGLLRAVEEEARKAGIDAGVLDRRLLASYGIPEELDHGALVPLYYITRIFDDCMTEDAIDGADARDGSNESDERNEHDMLDKDDEPDKPDVRNEWKGKVVIMGMSLLPNEELYAFGKAIQKAVAASDRRVVIVASGDLSHRLTSDAPAGYNPKGELFDRRLMELIREGKREEILNIDHDLIEAARECGYRSLAMLLGALDGYEVKSKVLSYEGPFGVGYGVACFLPGGYSEGKSILRRLFNAREALVREGRAKEDEFVKLARRAVEMYVTKGEVIDPPEALGDEMRGRAGVFCSIKKHGRLRGCIGTTQPTRRSIAHEIIANAISAATQDPRFNPVEPDELEELVYSVDVLESPEPVADRSGLDPRIYGVIVRSGYKLGLLLPDLEGVDTVEEQIEIARRKAGIGPGERMEIERFRVVRH